jgi:hypothetical protein
MALHEQCVGATDEWYTPKYVFDALNCTFDMDVASPNPPLPWIPTGRHLWSESLDQDWYGFIWMNPPFGGRNGLIPWLQKFWDHGNGIALVPDRTSAPWWQTYVPQADAVLFVARKIKFIGFDGKPGNSPAQGTCLIGLGAQAKLALMNAEFVGLGSVMIPADATSSKEGIGK